MMLDQINPEAKAKFDELVNQLMKTYNARKEHVEKSGQIDWGREKYAYAFFGEMLCKVRIIDYCTVHRMYAVIAISPALISTPRYLNRSELFPTRLDALKREYDRCQNIANAWKLRIELEQVFAKADVTIAGETFCTT